MLSKFLCKFPCSFNVTLYRGFSNPRHGKNANSWLKHVQHATDVAGSGTKDLGDKGLFLLLFYCHCCTCTCAYYLNVQFKFRRDIFTSSQENDIDLIFYNLCEIKVYSNSFIHSLLHRCTTDKRTIK